MMTNLRKLRLRRGIFVTELAAASGLSNQYISRAELRQISPTPLLECQMAAALETIINNRKRELLSLEADYLACRGRLLETAKDESNE